VLLRRVLAYELDLDGPWRVTSLERGMLVDLHCVGIISCILSKRKENLKVYSLI